MRKYYEPMLFTCSPEAPNTMGVLVTLKESVDADILMDVVEDLRE